MTISIAKLRTYIAGTVIREPVDDREPWLTCALTFYDPVQNYRWGWQKLAELDFLTPQLREQLIENTLMSFADHLYKTAYLLDKVQE